MTQNLFDLSGKVAIVTGSTRGLGYAIAEAFIAHGATVVVSSESAADTAEAAAVLGATGIVCDVSDEAANTALVAQTVGLHGGIDILVCNAGIQDSSPQHPLDMTAFDRVLGVNLRSMALLTKAALPYMSGRDGASIILMASISALRGNATIDAYALAKAGVVQLARNLAVQWGPKGVRSNAIAPGLIDTQLADQMKADATFMTRRMQMTLLRRMGRPQEVAGAAVFLASAAGGFVNGQTLVVDGGTVITDGS
ncbi:SDR family NAD(P)-dependent oxidoreductase [Subtercola boreus]|uniref:Short-chain dehydrogenase n=1 Tax=Subtercola boreus TaxID=120213 RepID=A0A3E0WAG6_9MICO|nr:SDR family oxidoreductase [Subtercola boreus]RFA18790.1 short-chain dehydrogenase [Subtercola boreus]RFA18905.1 short-chain dehydrogenase [Subtercola boreus]RFA25442.1 short-chain dehydrogenase [Subtercola boreus]